MANKEGCEGLQSYASWDLTCDINHLAMADYSWNFADSAKGAQKKIAKIAAERKINRIELIAEMEDFKEEYLHASHLRNQSIFMQTFADIEAYANKTPAKDFKLDVLDMREIGSKTFYNLR
jgi:hypothetical protein